MERKIIIILVSTLLLSIVFSGCFEEKSDKDTSADGFVKNEFLGNWFLGYNNSTQMWTFYKNGSILNTFYDSWEKPEIAFTQDDVNKTLIVISISSTDGLSSSSWASYEIKNNKLCFSGEGTEDVFCLDYLLNGDSITLSGEFNGTYSELRLVKSELSPHEVYDIDDKVRWDEINASLWLSVFDVKANYSLLRLQRSSVSYYGKYAPTEWGEVEVGDVLFVGEYNFGLIVDLDYWNEGFLSGGSYYFSKVPVIYYVGGSEAGNYTIIQDAIDDSTDGDIIYVYNGIYDESLNVNKSVKIIGEDKYTTIINGKNNWVCVYINARDATFSGFTVRYEGINTPADPDVMDAIIVSDYNINISNNIIDGDFIFGIALSNLASNCNVFNNSITNISQQALSIGSSHHNVYNNYLENNDDGISIGGSNNNVFNNIIKKTSPCITLRGMINNNSIYKNTFENAYQAVYSYNFTGTPTNNVFYHNNFLDISSNYDESNNIWYNSLLNEGNYWDDYIDKYPSASNDGTIWDTPYIISGGDNQDIYPLVNPVEI